MLVDNADAFARALAHLRSLPADEPLCIDTETTGLDPWRRENPDRLVGISVCGLTTPDTGYYFSWRHAEGDNLPLELMGPIRELLGTRECVYHNAAFDIPMMWHDGFKVPRRIADTLIAAHLANENEGDDNKKGFALKVLGVKYLGASADDEQKALHEHLKARKLRGPGHMWKLPAALVAPYAVQDVHLTRDLYWNRRAELERWRLLPLFEEVSRFLLATIRMSMKGLLIDRDEIGRQRTSIGPRLASTQARIRELAGFDINVNSSKQLQTWLGLKSTAKKDLLAIQAATPREDIQQLLVYRQLKKAESSFFLPLLERADTNDRIHTNYRVAGTVTGRLSSSSPNLQQMSNDEREVRAYSVRRCVTAPKPPTGSSGYWDTFLAEFDYSTIEPRIAAHYSQDATMKDAFLKGVDFHTAIAREMYRKKDIDKGERTRAKNLGLGILYGMGSYKAAVTLGLRHEKLPHGGYEFHHDLVWVMRDDNLTQVACSEASEEFCSCAGKVFIQKYYTSVPELEPFVRMLRNKASTYGYIRNPVSGRVRRFVGKNSHPHKALNSLIQGTAADILRRALVRLDELFEDDPDAPRMTLTVHDSLLFEVKVGPKAADYLRTIKSVMEESTKLDVPIPVDAKIGTSWGGMVDVHLDA